MSDANSGAKSDKFNGGGKAVRSGEEDVSAREGGTGGGKRREDE